MNSIFTSYTFLDVSNSIYISSINTLLCLAPWLYSLLSETKGHTWSTIGRARIKLIHQCQPESAEDWKYTNIFLHAKFQVNPTKTIFFPIQTFVQPLLPRHHRKVASIRLDGLPCLMDLGIMLLVDILYPAEDSIFSFRRWYLWG